MGDLTLNPNLVAQSYDTNKNKVIDELKIKPEAMERIDTDKNGQVSVGELASGIGNDRVLIKDGQVHAAKGSLTIPNLFQDVENVNNMARNTLSRTDAFWNTPEPSFPRKDNFYYNQTVWNSEGAERAYNKAVNAYNASPTDHAYPNKSDYQKDVRKFDQSGYNTAKNNYYSQLAAYKQDLLLDKALLVNTLQNAIQTTDDGNVQNIARRALDNQQYRDFGNIMSAAFDEGHSFKAQYETDRMLLRNAVFNIADVTEFTQPSKSVGMANQQIKGAAAALETEQNAINANVGDNVKKAQEHIDKINNGWMPFKKMRVESVEKKIAEVKSFDTAKPTENLAQVAKQTYETAVNAMDWNSINEARNISQKAGSEHNQVYNIQDQAEKETKKINKLK